MNKSEEFYRDYYEKDHMEDESFFKLFFKKRRCAGFVSYLLDMLRKKKIKSICDVGCGNGFFASFFHKHGFDVDGYDISKKRLESAKKRNKGPGYFLFDFENGSPKKKYDCVYAFNLIEHIYDYDKFLSNVYKCLNHGGLAVILTPNLFAPKRRIKILLGTEDGLVSKAHIHFFTPATLKKVLENNGLKLLKMEGLGFFSFLGPNFSGVICAIGVKK